MRLGTKAGDVFERSAQTSTFLEALFGWLNARDQLTRATLNPALGDDAGLTRKTAPFQAAADQTIASDTDSADTQASETMAQATTATPKASEDVIKIPVFKSPASITGISALETYLGLHKSVFGIALSESMSKALGTMIAQTSENVSSQIKIDTPKAPDPQPMVVTKPATTPVEETTPTTGTEDPAGTAVSTGTTATTGTTQATDTLPSGEPVTLSGAATTAIAGGRVTTLLLPDAVEATGIKITSLPAAGNVTVNPDLSLSLVLSGTTHTGPLSFSYKVTHSDGSVTSHTANFSVAAATQQAGWGFGDNQYMLATDASGDVVIETGDNHRKVYVSGSQDALTKADIAALEGLKVDQITTKWLLANPEYGGSEDMALATDVGMEVWYGLGAKASSNWLLFERGYTYEGTGRLILSGARGENALAPIHITSWGEGDRPVIADDVHIYQKTSMYLAFTDVAFTGGVSSSTGSQMIFDNVELTQDGFNVRTGSGFTLRNSEIMNVVKQEQLEGDYWTGIKAGMLVVDVDGILIENNFVHHNGWMDDYLRDGSVKGGAPPNMFSHNVYLQSNTTDVTFRDNIVSQAASIGAQIRGGGFVEGNLFLDNNVAVNFLGGDYKGAGPVGNYTLFADNLITSAGFKDAPRIGAKDWGFQNEARDTTLIGNIVTNKADPNNPDEMSAKKVTGTNPASNTFATYYDDTIIHNWNKYSANVDGLNAAELKQVTIQNFALEFLGTARADIPANQVMSGYYKSGLLTALLDHIAMNGGTDAVSAQEIIAWFQDGFGVDANGDGSSIAHRFIPNDLGDGVRWDNRLNWSSQEQPTNGDDVDLGGNWVNFGATTVHVDDIAFGSNGKLQVTSGKFSVDGTLTVGGGGAVIVKNSGQFWMEGYEDSDRLSVQVDGGRFANTGDMTGTTRIKLTDGQAILGMDNASLHLDNGDVLWIQGSTAKVGFDGGQGGIATLEMEDNAELTFVADALGVSTIREFRSGYWDQAGSNVRSGVRLDGDLNIDLTAWGAQAGKLTLIAADAITGRFDTASIHGLSKTLDAELVVDYSADTVILNLATGTGKVSTRFVGTDNATDENAALWTDLTAGHALDGGKTAIHSLTTAVTPLDDIPFF
jgi:hypothetical protein